MNTPYGQHFSYSSPNAPWGEYFVGGGPGVPLERTTGFPGMAIPKGGQVVVNHAPGFGRGLTLDDIAAMSG